MPDIVIDELANGNNAFALDTYSKIIEKDENIIFSPFSIAVCLAMVYAGARNDTETEMKNTLHIGLDQDLFHETYHKILNALQANNDKPGCQINIANSLWIEERLSLLEKYLTLIKKNYGDTIFNVDFVNSANVIKDQINAWVSEHTNGKIKDILDKLSSSNKLILVNAIYFNCNWDIEFDKQLTKDDKFTLITKEQVEVPMMQGTALHYYHEEPNFQVLGMYYKVRTLAMVIILPKSVDDFKTVERYMTHDYLQQLFGVLQAHRVQVFLPRFKITASFGLNTVLMALGMKESFSIEKADFSGITDGRGLFISSVIHKAFIDVNEEGTEAAAATVVSMAPKGIPQKPPTFRADRPFFFFIRDLSTKNILFMGRVMNPLEEG